MKRFLGVLTLAMFVIPSMAQEITVSGRGILKRKPDTASFQISVQGKAKSGDKAQEAMIKAIVAVQAVINSLKLEAKTLRYSIIEDKSHRRTSNDELTTVVNGFIATTVYIVRVNDLNTLTKALEMTGLPGVSKAAYLEFDLKDRSLAERQARSLALEDAIANATAIAKTAGKSSFDILRMQQPGAEFEDMFEDIRLPLDSIKSGGKGYDEEGRPIVVMGAMMADSLPFTDAIIVPGEMTVTASVVIAVRAK